VTFSGRPRSLCRADSNCRPAGLRTRSSRAQTVEFSRTFRPAAYRAASLFSAPTARIAARSRAQLSRGDLRKSDPAVVHGATGRPVIAESYLVRWDHEVTELDRRKVQRRNERYGIQRERAHGQVDDGRQDQEGREGQIRIRRTRRTRLPE